MFMCQIPACEKPPFQHDLCEEHAREFARSGNPSLVDFVDNHPVTMGERAETPRARKPTIARFEDW